MKKIFIQVLIVIFMFFVLFSDVLFNIFKLPFYFRWWDVILEIVLLIFFTVKLIRKKISKDNNIKITEKYIICYIMLIAIVITGLLGDIIFKYCDSFLAVVKDILSFLKFPLTLLLIKNLGLDCKVGNLLDKKFYNILKGFIVIIFFLGVISIFWDIGMSIHEYRHGIMPYTFIFSHPTYLVMSMILILALFEYNQKDIENVIVYEVLIVLITFLTMRTKAIAFLAVFLIIKFFGKYIKKYKKTSAIVICLVILATVYSKLALYASFSSSTREVLYKGCVILIEKCFPIGSGFATYASHISGQYISKVYEFINVNYVFETGYLAQLGDVGFPYYIGQFGVLGCAFIIVLAYEIVKICTEKCKNVLPVYIILMYILIGLTTESTLLNLGTELAIVLAIISTNKIKDD